MIGKSGHFWPRHMDDQSRADLTNHLTELVREADTIQGIGNMDQLHHQSGKVEAFRYLLSVVQSAK